jgi:predicted  nucleic acid-binding Zn-ribbon protein
VSHKCGQCGVKFNNAKQAKCGRPVCPARQAVAVLATTRDTWGLPDAGEPAVSPETGRKDAGHVGA